jgi:hypothetical protein
MFLPNWPVSDWSFSLVDEDLPRSLAPWLTAAGRAAEDVLDRGLRGQQDDVFRHAVAHGFAILSGDLGFGNLVRFSVGTHHVVSRRPTRSTNSPRVSSFGLHLAFGEVPSHGVVEGAEPGQHLGLDAA